MFTGGQKMPCTPVSTAHIHGPYSQVQCLVHTSCGHSPWTRDSTWPKMEASTETGWHCAWSDERSQVAAESSFHRDLL